MKKKISILSVAIVLTIVIFAISTALQKSLVQYVPMVKCFVFDKDCDSYSKVSEDDFKLVDMPLYLLSDIKFVQTYEEISNLYLKADAYKGQVLVLNQFDTKENLSIYEAEIGKEKISVFFKDSDNLLSYNVREGNVVNLYATVRTEYVGDIFKGLEINYTSKEHDSYAVIKLLSNCVILGAFNQDGQSDFSNDTVETLMFAVSSDDAKRINLIKDLAVFNITGSGGVAVSNEVFNNN